MYINVRTERVMKFLKEENDRYYFYDTELDEYIDYAESSYKRYLKPLGLEEEIQQDHINDEIFVLLRHGNYLPRWVLDDYMNVDTMTDYYTINIGGYYRGTDLINDDPRSLEVNYDEFYKLLERYPIMADAKGTSPVRISQLSRHIIIKFLLTGVVTLGPNGLYIKKGVC